MHVLRRSLSAHRSHSAETEDYSSVQTHRSVSATSKRNYSLGNLVIPGRTRYPSDKGPHLEPIDLHVAKALLDHEQSIIQEPTATLAPVTHRAHKPHSRSSSTTDPSHGPRRPRLGTRHAHNLSQCVSGQSRSDRYHVGRCSSSSNGPTDRDTSQYVAEYNVLAERHGLTELVAFDEGNIPKEAMGSAIPLHQALTF